MPVSAKNAATMAELLKSHGLTGDSRLYRSTLPEFLEPTKQPGVFRLSANTEPSESVTNVYGQGHLVLAEKVGAGLAFSQAREHQWKDARRKQVEVRLQDVLDQGGLVYPVESVVTEKVWYFTLPAGGVAVRVVD